MFDWKPVTLGLLVTIFVGLFLQLIFTLIASMIGSVHDTSFVATHKPQLWFVFALLTLSLSVFIGGFVTALLTEGHGMFNAISVGVVTVVLSLWVSLTYSGLTWVSLAVIGICVASAAAGSRLSEKMFIDTVASEVERD